MSTDKVTSMSKRPSARLNDEMRHVSIETNINAYAEGSCLISFGNTKVICTASVSQNVPRWLKGQKQGWITAEYGMLPRSTHSRMDREAVKGKQSGRTQEISRLIGRSLRSVVDLKSLGERTIQLDCDVIQADGGTRTASITGAYVALHLAVQKLFTEDKIDQMPLTDYVAAISCGITSAGAVSDLDYKEDSNAIADGNFVMTGNGMWIEQQVTAEQAPISSQDIQGLHSLAEKSIAELVQLQKKATGEAS
jgi:ribonuclease PH